MNNDLKAPRQPRLILFGILFVFFYTAALSLASAIRTHAPGFQVDWYYFIPFAAWLIGALGLDYAVKRFLPNRDPWIFPVVMLLCGWGLLTIWRLSPTLGQRQIIWFLLACLLFYFGIRQKELVSKLKGLKYLWLLFGLLLIGLTFWIGVNPSGSGPTRWLSAFGIFFQPSEPLKLFLLVYIAAYFADQVKPNTSLIASILPTLIIIAVIGVMLISQRDLGTAALFLGFYVLMLTVSSNSRKYLWIVPVLAIIAIVVGYFTLDIVKTRVDIWLNPWLNTSGSSYQIAQAQIAVASGGLYGTGPGLGSPGFVPVAVSDFIFTAIAEETGLIGTSALLILFAIVIIRGINIALASKTTYGRYLAFGISMFLTLQCLWIICGNLGLLPLTGVTLPFMSYGGSSLVTSILAILLLLKISADSSTIPLPDKARKPYHRIAAIVLGIFVLIIGWNSYLAIFNQDAIVNKAENMRWAIDDRYSPLGNISDQSGNPIVRTIGTPGDYERELLVPGLSITIGYTNPVLGKSGLERSLYPYLRGTETRDETLSSQYQLLYNQPPPGSDVSVNIILDLQAKADKLLGDKHGAIILMNAVNGEIYAMVSHPYFDYTSIAEDWDSWRQREDAPLLNRVTQGVYPLGTLANGFALSSYWVQEGTNTLSIPLHSDAIDPLCGKMLTVTDQVNPIQHGCQEATRDLINANDPLALTEQLDKFGFYSIPSFSLELAQPTSRPGKNYFNNIQTLIPATQLSPLQMALIAASITNDGDKITPRLVNAYQTENGSWKSYTEPSQAMRVLPQTVAKTTRDYFSQHNKAYWYMMGHSAMEEEQTIVWYVGGTNDAWTGTPMVIVIALEDSQPDLAYRIADQLFVPQSED
ncbi:MAG TPA: FtsW/RodA/SpoVE family cell cycle protein [Anaerolineaceae bacterium]|nr:FtsW/RodA/SpoVE family cell cycle protein [Anaerolineaceae bacterium]